MKKKKRSGCLEFIIIGIFISIILFLDHAKAEFWVRAVLYRHHFSPYAVMSIRKRLIRLGPASASAIIRNLKHADDNGLWIYRGILIKLGKNAIGIIPQLKKYLDSPRLPLKDLAYAVICHTEEPAKLYNFLMTSIKKTSGVRFVYLDTIRRLETHEKKKLLFFIIKMYQHQVSKVYDIEKIASMYCRFKGKDNLQDKRIQKIVAKWLHHKNEKIRLSAIQILARVSGPKSFIVPLIIKALNDPEPWVKLSAAQALAIIAPQNKFVQLALSKTIKEDGGDAFLFRSIITTLQKANTLNQEIVPVLNKVLFMPHPWRLEGVARLLQYPGIDPSQASSGLFFALTHTALTKRVRYEIAAALGKIGKKAQPLLLQVIRKKNSAFHFEGKTVRTAAVYGLQYIGKEAIPFLKKTLLDKEHDVRVQAIRGLYRFIPETLPEVIQGFTNFPQYIQQREISWLKSQIKFITTSTHKERLKTCKMNVRMVACRSYKNRKLSKSKMDDILKCYEKILRKKMAKKESISIK